MLTNLKFGIFLLTLIPLFTNAQSLVTIDLSKNWHFSPDENNVGISEKWYKIDFDDSQWAIIDGGKKWEDQGYPELDSVAWYRKRVAIPADWNGKKVWVKFGGVNDHYELFLNGKSVGSKGDDETSVATVMTYFNITEDLAYGEANSIALRVKDMVGSGGLWRLPVIITTDESEINYELKKNFPIIVYGKERQNVDFELQDGGLRPVIGVHNIPVYRPRIRNFGTDKEDRWTYNHHQGLAIWEGRLYAAWATTPIDEDVPPYRVVYATSADGFTWSEPKDLFPEEFAWASRFYFYRAANGRMLTLTAGHKKSISKIPEEQEAYFKSMEKPNLMVREIFEDHRLGEVYSLVNPQAGFPESFERSSDQGFLDACKEAIANKPLLEQGDYGIMLGERKMKWHAITPKFEGFYSFGKGFSFYHRKDGDMVGISKMGFVTVSKDDGDSWSKPVNPPTFVTGAAKAWGQKSNDGRYALIYNPSTAKRYPLVLVHGDDGKNFYDMRVIHGEFPHLRYPGLYKDVGPQYIRGVAEWANDGTLKDKNAIWLIYSVGKEDMWISRVPLPIKPDETEFPIINFNNMSVGSYVTDWNIYSPAWAPISVVTDTGSNYLELKDADTFDDAHAVRMFPRSSKVRIKQEFKALQTDSRFEIDLCDSIGRRPIRIALTEKGRIEALNGSESIDLGKYTPGENLKLIIETDLQKGSYTIQMNGNKPIQLKSAEKDITSVERFSLRTGYWHGMTDKLEIDPNTDNPDEKPAVYHIKSVSITLLD